MHFNRMEVGKEPGGVHGSQPLEQGFDRTPDARRPVLQIGNVEIESLSEPEGRRWVASADETSRREALGFQDLSPHQPALVKTVHRFEALSILRPVSEITLQARVMDAGIERGHERCEGRECPWGRGYGVVKAHTFGREPVHVRRCGPRVAIATEVVGSQRVYHKEKDAPDSDGGVRFASTAHLFRRIRASDRSQRDGEDCQPRARKHSKSRPRNRRKQECADLPEEFYGSQLPARHGPHITRPNRGPEQTPHDPTHSGSKHGSVNGRGGSGWRERPR